MASCIAGPPTHKGDAIVNVIVDPPFCSDYEESNCGEEAAEGIGCTPPDASVQGYNRIWSCGDQSLDENQTAVFNVSGYISTLCPTLCKSATVHEITIDINKIRAEDAAAINVTAGMMAAYSADRFNMTLAEYE